VEYHGSVDVNWTASDLAAFELGPTHAGAHSLDDEITFQFGDRSDREVSIVSSLDSKSPVVARLPTAS
jgi:hypothetical protein